MAIGIGNSVDLNIQVLESGGLQYEGLLAPLIEGGAISLWEQVGCTSMVPGHKVTMLFSVSDLPTDVVPSPQEQPKKAVSGLSKDPRILVVSIVGKLDRVTLSRNGQ